MRIELPEFKKEDGTRVIICLYVFENYREIKYRIDDVCYCEPRKRTWKSLEASFRDSYEYRRLEVPERRKYEIEKYIAFVGEYKLKEAIMLAWEKIKPNVEEVLTNA